VAPADGRRGLYPRRARGMLALRHAGRFLLVPALIWWARLSRSSRVFSQSSRQEMRVFSK
jgi:hypothetical protein